MSLEGEDDEIYKEGRVMEGVPVEPLMDVIRVKVGWKRTQLEYTWVRAPTQGGMHHHL
jgi:hypothetical protein